MFGVMMIIVRRITAFPRLVLVNRLKPRGEGSCAIIA